MIRRVLIALLVTAVAVPALAVKHRRPYHPAIKLGYGYDNNYSAGGCADWACGGTCYNTHTGSDFPLPLGTDVLAGAPGKVVQVVQGCADYGYYGNPCGGKCGNYVRIQHADGSRSLYCHMKNGSITVNVNQQVACGQKIGRSASSGSSTGPHLHFGWYPNGSSSSDPFKGSCSGSSGWVNQGSYPGLPSTGCEVSCACSPGKKQSQGCGKCGTRTRTCGGNCQWGGWSGCNGQGPCSPGQKQSGDCGNCGTHSRTCQSSCQWGGWGSCGGQGPCSPGQEQSEACCDCGERSRTCNGACEWASWSSCAGPDPEGSPGCDTGKLGDCAAGVMRCVEGCLTCTDTTEPTPEQCDGRDNDCDGPIDEEATEMGSPPPMWAADLVDLSAPTSLRPGEPGLVWAAFRNVGSDPWPAGATWLGALDVDGELSLLWDEDGWSAWDVAAPVTSPVAPGEVFRFSFPVSLPDGLGPNATDLETRFVLAVEGQPMLCPAPGFSVTVLALEAAEQEEPEHEPAPGALPEAAERGPASRPARRVSTRPAGVSRDPAPEAEEAIPPAGQPAACSASDRGSLSPWWALLLLALPVWRRRRAAARGMAAVVLLVGCAEAPPDDSGYDTIGMPLNAYCTVHVIGKGNKAVETDYLARVIRCENGSAPLEALKAQAVAARSYLYYKLNTSGSIADGQSDQVYTCGPQPTAIHHQAVQETAGQVLRYANTQVAAFYVAGAIPSTTNCVAKASDNDYSNTEHYVTYNQGKSGSGLTQTTLGWVNPGNYANRGCKSQNGASCLAKKGWGYKDILKFYYGADIQLVTATGSCVQQCECDPGKKQTQACGNCGTRTRTCNSSCKWGGWSGCSGQGACSPGKKQTQACGNCGERTRTCKSSCSWGGWSGCSGEGPCAPGAEQTEACGNCGDRSRSCSAQCTWAGWSSCGGQGECAPGSVDQQACGDCGVQERTCSEQCGYGAFTACEGIDPVEDGECDTGELGICKAGVWQCVGGNTTCAGHSASAPEVCDGLDNDCDGVVDDGSPPLGIEPPGLAATLDAVQLPGQLVAGASAQLRATFTNVGADDWPEGSMWVIADGPADGATSELYSDQWAADGLVMPLPYAVPSGGSASVLIPVIAPETPGDHVIEVFRLSHGERGPLTCPTPRLEVDLPVVAAPEGVDGTDGMDGLADGTDGTGEVQSTDGTDGEMGGDGGSGVTDEPVDGGPVQSLGGSRTGTSCASGGRPGDGGRTGALLLLATALMRLLVRRKKEQKGA